MATSKQIRLNIEAAQANVTSTMKRYAAVKSDLSKVEDVLISEKEILRKLQEELEVVERNEITVVEEDEDEKIVSDFRKRLPAVLNKLEENGTGIIKDPIKEFVRLHLDLVNKFTDYYVVASYQHGIIAGSKNRDKFSLKLSGLDPSIRQTALIFFVNDYIKLDSAEDWIKKNEDEISKHVGKHIAVHARLGIIASNEDVDKVKIYVDANGYFGQVVYKFVQESLKSKVMSWLDKHRSRVIGTHSFSEAANIIGRALALSEEDFPAIAKMLHGAS